MPEPCVFPDCTAAAAVRRTDGTLSCHLHEHVTVATSGSWLEDDTHHHLPKGRG